MEDDAIRKKKGKCKEGENCFDEKMDASSTNRLATLDIFAGCGGLSEGLEKSGRLCPFITYILFFLHVLLSSISSDVLGDDSSSPINTCRSVPDQVGN